MPKSERIEFPGATGHRLAARLERAEGEAKAVALFAHCFSCSKDVFAASRIAGQLAVRGISVLRFDFTGLGASEGDFANTNFSSNVADLVAAADWLRAEGMAPSLLVGHSLGGAACLVAAGRIPEVRAVATVGAPASADHVEAQFAQYVPEIEAKGEVQVQLVGRAFRIQRQFLEDVRSQNVTAAVANLRRALLILHAPLDTTVGIENAGHIFTAAKHPKSFVSLDGADHLLSRKADALYAADVIAAWAARYVLTGGDRPAPRGFAGGVAVEETGAGRYQNVVLAGRHTYLAGEPESLGGDDAGPTPFGWVSGGLGACTSITLRMYAERKNWPLERVRVEVAHSQEPGPDGRKRNVFERAVFLEGDLSEEQRARLLEIAEKCPVHIALHEGSEVRTRLAGEAKGERSLT